MTGLSRRFILGGLIAAPSIVHAKNIMPIYPERMDLELAYNATFDGYDVVFPPNWRGFRMIKPEHEVFDDLWHIRPFGSIVNWKHTYDTEQRVDDEGIEKYRSKLRILNGQEKRAVYASFMGTTPKAIEQRFSTIDARSSWRSLEHRKVSDKYKDQKLWYYDGKEVVHTPAYYAWEQEHKDVERRFHEIKV